MLDDTLHSLHSWFGELNYMALGWELVILIMAATAALMVHRSLGRFLLDSTVGDPRQMRRLTLRSVQRIVFPLSMLLGVLAGRAVLNGQRIDVLVLNLAVPLLVSLGAIRLAVYVLRKGLRPGPAVKAWEHIISTTIWILVALHLLGWLPDVLRAMDAFGYSFGNLRISLLTSLQLAAAIGALMVFATWLSKLIERGLTGSPHLTPGVKIGLAKTSKFALYTLAAIIGLNTAGIDLGALAVFGGALGVGLGFGLQRIASNFISGFILVFDRSIRPGDVISVKDKFGWVQELRARYIVVRDRDGVETLIPNENLITTEVINWSYSDEQIRLKIPVQISYADDPEQAMEILLNAACASTRVLPDPAPAARLMGFGDNGIEMELRVWIRDPQEGVAAVRSDVNLAIWKGFRDAGITIPFPQRDLYLKELPESFGAPAAAAET
ncbi:MAG: mechanosensitive ion channel [Thiogranum sp.]|nr:mechanosensitive ion channel [Thiogranum sp.]